ncbi:ACT domain-containing protein ACR10 [Amaranthus tricolor]|uniref:ACT domain-containing protein ACR10 n=1 Tax=Amaranthus tricolor TaxID=29722 RepID=UPI00258BF960|nr:ACT domain-containing protein ACR10 [Amaranthus tricolor]
MWILHDDVVVFKAPEKEGDPTVITVNCPDKLGLACDLCRILLFFGFIISRVDFATDGRWCYIVLWVIGKPETKWGLVKKRLVGACPSCYSASGISYYREEFLKPPRSPDVFLVKLCCHDRRGLLHDITEVLCELELNIQRVKVSTTPDGRVLDLFFVTDTRELLHTKKRQEDTKDHLRETLGDAVICDIEKVGPEVTACSQSSSFLPSVITDETFNCVIPDKHHNGTSLTNSVSIMLDNSLSPSHTLVQIVCRDYRGLLYDLMRTFKDYNIQISYGRGTTKQKNCEIDLFIVQADGKKIVDPNKQNALRSRLFKELARPFKVAVVSRGPDTELLVANPVELSGRGRPHVFYDVTLALKMLNLCIFSAEIGRHVIEHRECEVYRFLLQEGECLSVPRKKIEEMVWNTLMGWE